MPEHPITAHPMFGMTEPFSSLSHFLGAFVFLCLARALLRRGRGGAARIASLAIFVACVFFVLMMSALYHLLPPDTPQRHIFQRLDHAAIFAVIAGSFTPPHIILFRGWWRWGVLAPVWALALTGMTISTYFPKVIPEWGMLAFYLGLGWIGAISGIRLWYCFSFGFIKPVLLGGLAYTLGALIDFSRAPILIPGVIESHELFHLAVLAGMALHWRFMLRIADGRFQAAPVQAACKPVAVALENI